MDKNEKMFRNFLVGLFITATLIISFYRVAETNDDFFAFFFLSALILLFFSTFLLESMFLDSVTDKLIETANESIVTYNLIFFLFFMSIFIGIPLFISHSINVASNQKQETAPNNCLVLVDKLFQSSKSVYDKKLLKNCQYTKPLTSNAQNFLEIINDYLELSSKSLSFALTSIMLFFGGTSYLAIGGLVVKKGAFLILNLFNSAAIKMISDGEFPPRTRQR